jgi:ABC-type oligopeptide transport system substrate-binding subunit
MTRLALALLVLAGASCARNDSGLRVAGAAPRYFGDVRPPAGQTFTFNNGAEPERIDPGVISGQPDGRVARMLFEGLTTPHPRTLEPLPGQAYRWELSADGRTYTFHLRPGLAWSDGRPLTAEDFRWSWVRVLRPETASRYSGLLYLLENGKAFNKGEITDERLVGVAAPDDSTLVVRLEQPTPYFLYLTQYYTLLPVPRPVVERWGQRWTRPEHVVGNGPFLLARWRQGDRFEFVRNPRYWDAASVRLERVVALSVDDLNTSANLYKAGVTDWNPSGYLPSQFVPYLRGYDDFRTGRYQGIYFYSFNLTRKPFDDVRVRRALAYATDREAIARDLLKGSRDPWGNFVPSGYPLYVHPPGQTYDPEKARASLASAGFPGGKGFPKVEILFNTSEDHRRVAEAIQAMWKRTLGIDVELSNQEWGSYLQATTSLQYQVARRSWIGDYLDPNTFLECMVGGDGNNRTGWSDRRYDALIARAARELDAERRARIMAEAESLLLEAAPIIPIYHYNTTELVKPYVRGLHPTALDTHPLKHVWIDHQWDRADAPVARAEGGADGGLAGAP